MHVYFIGINGAGISALAHFALDAGYKVSGSDMQLGLNTAQLEARGAHCSTGDDVNNIAHAHKAQPIDWVVASSAVPNTSPELQYARSKKIKTTKRTDFINLMCTKHNLKILAVAGTHGKTTTSAMTAWALRELKLTPSHIIGTNLSFANSGAYVENSKYLVLEADEYDRMMLAFHPEITLITSIDYDHPDIYPTKDSYMNAFRTFINQSEATWAWLRDLETIQAGQSNTIFALESPQLTVNELKLPGNHNRANAELVATALSQALQIAIEDILGVLESFPGTARRFEQLSANLYSDYGHTPSEIAATLQLAREQSKEGQKIVVVYQPHQNARQHVVQADYKDVFSEAQAVYWLPTYLSREDPNQPVLTPEQLISNLNNPAIATPAEINNDLAETIKEHIGEGDLVVLFGAGSIDDWARNNLL